jgi:SpoVK/Ycf46/Vps4 family AAA+-type ATPase
MVAKITYRNGGVYANTTSISISIKAIIHELLDMLTKSNDIHRTYKIKEFMIDRINEELLSCVTFNTGGCFRIAPNIFISTTLVEDKGFSNEDINCVNYTITLYTDTFSPKDINEFIEKCIKKYQQHKLERLKQLQVFIFNNCEDKENEKNPEFQEIPFESNKTFDNMFFEQKEELMQKLMFFQNNKDQYRRLGIPYTFGILFHGQPGCGKTSCIKSLARHTQRHIVMIPVKRIKNIEILKKIFMSPKINDYHVPNDKRLYVFEEIDCGQWRNVVLSRSLKGVDDTNDNTDHFLCNHATVVDKDVTTIIKQNKMDVTLGDFLELLDGIIEISGRMMVMTSNHPEIIDPAVMRPGRVDMVVHFRKMTRDDVSKMYKLWFDDALPNHVISCVKDYVFSQADISFLFSISDRDIIHTALIRGEMPCSKK